MDPVDSDSLSRVDPTQVPLGIAVLRLRDYHPLWSTFQTTSAELQFAYSIGTNSNEGPTTPRGMSHGFRLFRVRSPLLTESLLLSFPPGTEMFQFPGFS